jgi:hypothetical protein
MMAIEDRVRDTLGELADTVAPSHHPRADFDRRLARRRATRWRTPVLATAAAFVAVAGVGIPVAMNRSGDSPGQRVATSSPSLVPATPVEVPIGSVTVNGVAETVVFTTRPGNEWCVGLRSQPSAPTCETAPAWPVAPGDRHVESRPVLGEGPIDSGPLPNLMVFVTDPVITTLDVRDGPGAPVEVSRIAATAGATYYLADFGGTSQGFGYDAKDAQGAIVESAIT